MSNVGRLIFASVATHRIRSGLYAAKEDLIAVSVEGVQQIMIMKEKIDIF